MFRAGRRAQSPRHRLGRRPCALAKPAFQPWQANRQQMATPGSEHRQVQVVVDREAQQEPRGLERSRQPGTRAQARRLVGDISTEELDRAFGRRKLAGDDVEQRRLAGSVRPEDGATLARLHGQGHVGHRSQAAEPPPDPPQVEDRRGGLEWLRCCAHTARLISTERFRS